MLLGIDLFNHGFYWEAHESWEAVWHAVGRSGPLANLLKGLIKLAAAAVKAREGNAVGMRRHAARAGELFASVAASLDPGQHRLLGLALDELAATAAAMAGPESAKILGPDPTLRLPFVLRPMPAR